MEETIDHVDFKHLDIGTVELLVGKKATDVQVHGKWVVCTFPGELGDHFCGSTTTVRFRKW